MAELPTATHSAEFLLCGVWMRCHYLDNGKRVIESDDMLAFLRALEGDCSPLDEAELAELAEFIGMESP